MKTFTKVLIVFTFMLIVVGVAVSPVFNSVSAEVSGLDRLNEQDIMKEIGLDKSVNLFLFDKRSAKKKLLKNTYIEKVDFVIDYKNKTIAVRVTERILSGYVQYPGGIYLYIDEYGYVLESAESYTERLPLVVGLKIDEFTVGKFLNVENDKSFKIVVTLAQLFNEYDLESDVIKVDVTDALDIHLYIKNVDIEFGSFYNVSDTDEKIRVLKAVLPYLPEKNSILDIKDVTKPARFRLLT